METKHTIEFIKRKAKTLKKEKGITHTQALDEVAKVCGYFNFAHCFRVLAKKD